MYVVVCSNPNNSSRQSRKTHSGDSLWLSHRYIQNRLLNNNKTQNVKNAKKVKKDFNKVGRQVADFTGEPAAKVTTGKIEFDKETGF